MSDLLPPLGPARIDLPVAAARVDDLDVGVFDFKPEGWTADQVLALEKSYRGCLTEEQTAAWAAERMDSILDELKRLHGIG